MWRDPMDELIAELEQIAPPEQSKFGGNPEDLMEVQKWSAQLLRRAEEWPEPMSLQPGTAPDGFGEPERERTAT